MGEFLNNFNNLKGKFDDQMKQRVNEAIEKVIVRELPMTMESIRDELDMGKSILQVLTL